MSTKKELARIKENARKEKITHEKQLKNLNSKILNNNNIIMSIKNVNIFINTNNIIKTNNTENVKVLKTIIEDLFTSKEKLQEGKIIKLSKVVDVNYNIMVKDATVNNINFNLC